MVQEGLAREFVRRVQELRKTSDFEIADRIRLWVQATSGLAEAIQRNREYIQGETLAVELNLGEAPSGAAEASAKFDGEEMKVGILKV